MRKKITINIILIMLVLGSAVLSVVFLLNNIALTNEAKEAALEYIEETNELRGGTDIVHQFDVSQIDFNTSITRDSIVIGCVVLSAAITITLLSYSTIKIVKNPDFIAKQKAIRQKNSKIRAEQRTQAKRKRLESELEKLK